MTKSRQYSVGFHKVIVFLSIDFCLRLNFLKAVGSLQNHVSPSPVTSQQSYILGEIREAARGRFRDGF